MKRQLRFAIILISAFGLMGLKGSAQGTGIKTDLPGSTCENPILVDIYDAPLSDFQINSEHYGNNYSSSWVTPSSNYLNGNDVVFKFTITASSFVNVSIAGSWTGFVMVAECPDAENPPEVLANAQSSSGGSVSNVALEAGDYYMIASTWPSPQFTDMTINLSAVVIPTSPNLVVNPTEIDFGSAAVGFAPSTRSLSLFNSGLGDLVINETDIVISGADAASFGISLPEGEAFPVSLEFEESIILSLSYSPDAAGQATASLGISYNHPDNGLASVPLSGNGYLPLTQVIEDFSSAVIPNLPDMWFRHVESSASGALVNSITSGTPYSPPNHITFYNATDIDAQLYLISPVVTNFEDSWLVFYAKMSSATHEANIEVGVLTDPNDPLTFIPVGNIPVTGSTYTQYDVEFDDQIKTLLPEAGYLGLRFHAEATYRRLYIDNFTYGEKPDLPIFEANKDEIDFGDNVWINTTTTSNLQVSNAGVGLLTINQGDVTITGDDQTFFNVVYPDDMTWPIEIPTGGSYTFNLSFTPQETRAYSAMLNIQDNIGDKAINQIPMVGTGYDPTITPDFIYDFIGTFPPIDWGRFSGLLSDDTQLNPATSIWVHGKFGNVGSENNSARINIYGTSRNHWLITPPINLGDETTDYQLQFDLALTAYNSSNPGTMGATHKFGVIISTDNGVTWSDANILRMWTAATPISNTGEQITLDLSPYTGTVKIGFYGESTASGGDVDVYVTNVEVNDLNLYSATFVIEDLDAAPIADAIITINDIAYPAGEYTIMNLLAGAYSWSVEHEDYFVENGSFAITDENVTINVAMEAKPDIPFITGIAAVPDITVEYGTALAEAIASLSPTTTITDSNQDEYTVTLNWAIDGYDGEEAGDYPATGTFDLPEGVDQSDPPTTLEVTATITVRPAPVVISDFPWMEEFEGDDFPPLGWERFNVDGGGSQWAISSAQNHSPGGSQSAHHGYSSAAYQDGWLITPILDLPENTDMELIFWSYNGFPTWYEKNSVLISTGSADPADNDFVEVWTTETVASSWEQVTIDLTDYTGQEIFIAFRYEGDDAHDWFIDDVMVQEIPAVFSLTFVVEDGDGVAVNDAVITFDGNALNAGEYVIEDLLPGIYDYSVAKEGYITADGQATIVDQDVTVNVVLNQIPTYTVTFVVKDQDDDLLTDAEITFDGQEYGAGIYVFSDLLAGEYSYLVEKDGYEPASGTATVVDTDITVDVTLNEIIIHFSVTFAITDESGTSIPDATVTFDGGQLPPGEYIISGLLAGTYDYSVSRDGYETVTGSVTIIDSDELVNIEMTAVIELFTVTFIIEDEEGDPIADAIITFDGEQLEPGVYFIENLEAGIYPFAVDKDGYLEHTGNVTIVTEDVTVTVVLTEPVATYTVTFYVDMSYADFDPQNDIVYIGGDMTGWEDPGDDHENQVMTPVDDDPMTYYKVYELPAGVYEYKYFLNAGWDGGEWDGGNNRQIEVADDMTVNNIFGDPDDGTGVASIDPLHVTLFPNPASHNLNIAADNQIIEIKVIDMLGQVVYTSPAEGNSSEISVSNLRNGMYLIQIYTSKGITTQRIQVQR